LRATLATLETKTRSFADPGALDHATLIVKLQDPEVASQEVAQVLAGIRGPSPPFDGESVDIEPMNVLHRSRMDSAGTALDEIYAPTIPGSVDLAEPEEVQVLEPQHPHRRMGYFDLHPERRHVQVGGDGGDMSDESAQAAGGIETPP